MSKLDALKLAKEHLLDLVEVAPNANPPVCHIMDWGKFQYEQSKQKNVKSTIKTHEVKFGVNIADHDFSVKVKLIKKFLDRGDKVKIIIFFKGRQNAHKEIGLDLLDRILSEVDCKSTKPNTSGRNITIFLE